MSIARLKKVTLAAASRDQAQVVRGLQAFGELHIVDRQRGVPLDEATIFPRDKRADEAIQFLQRSRYHRRELLKAADFVFERVVDQALANRDRIRQCEDELDDLKARITLVRPWGDFTFPPEAIVEHFRLWFYRLPVNRRSALDRVNLPWQLVGRDSRHLFVVVIAVAEPPADLLPVPRVHLGSKPLRELLDAQDALEVQLEELYGQRQSLTRYLYLMRKHQIDADNLAHFRYVMAQVERRGELFTLQAWLPAARLPQLQAACQSLGCALIAEEPVSTDTPPTLLQPPPGFGSGALLAGIYQMPAYRGWDPSVHLYLSFALFFAMILSDAGYALLLAGLLGISWRRLGRSQTGAALRYLLRFMCLVGVGWGVLAGSYFGVTPAPAHWLAALHVIDVQDYSAMMRLSILVGVLHLVVANLTALYGRRHEPGYVLGRLGWICICSGGFCLWQSSLPWLTRLAQIGMGAGGLLVLLGSDGPSLTSLKGWAIRLGNGLLALTGLSKLFGDVLSYMRLFALGLASASLAITFNHLATNAMAHSAIGVVTGAGIFLVGHLINLGLALMSGTVHGLRLNFIEFYNWGEPGEGYAYTPFALKEIKHE